MYGPGTVVARKYRIERVLGEGGMGVVVAAWHLHLGTPVALKFLHQHMLQNQNVVDRFMREARASAQLRGENVCRVSDVGTLSNGLPYMVMELLEGQDLGAMLRDSGPLAPQVAAEVILQTCIALGEAHAIGLVHRDLKPGNLYWTRRPDGTPRIKVLDFGVVKAPAEIHASITNASSVIGSPGYMSPEQLKSSKTADVRSDIWSLGVVLYELVSGRKPFQGESITELALNVAMDPTPPLLGAAPETLESVILRCLEKDPEKRYQDVAELAMAIAPHAGPHGLEVAGGIARMVRGTNAASTPVAATPAPQPSTPTTLRGASGAVITRTGVQKRSMRLPIAIGLGAASGVVIAIVAISGGGPKSATSTNAASTPAPEKIQKMSATPAPAPPAPPAQAPAPAPAPPTESVAAAEPEPEPEPVKKPIAKKRTRPAAKKPAKPAAKKKPAAEDLGDSRF